MPLALPGWLSQGLALWFASAWGCGSVPTAPECAVGSSVGKGWGGAPGPALEGHSEQQVHTVGLNVRPRAPAGARLSPRSHGSAQRVSAPVNRRAPRVQGTKSSLAQGHAEGRCHGLT